MISLTVCAVVRDRDSYLLEKLMFKAFKVICAAGAGMLLAFGLVIAVELFSAVVHPFPPDFKHTPDEMCAHVARYPEWVLQTVVVLWSATTYISTWVAARLGNVIAGMITGALLILAAAFNVSMLPYPTWFSAAILVCLPVVVILALYPFFRKGIAPPVAVDDPLDAP